MKPRRALNKTAGSQYADCPERREAQLELALQWRLGVSVVGRLQTAADAVTVAGSGGDLPPPWITASTAIGRRSEPSQRTNPPSQSGVAPLEKCSSSCGTSGKRLSRTLNEGQPQLHTAVTHKCGSDSRTRAAPGASTFASASSIARCQSLRACCMVQSVPNRQVACTALRGQRRSEVEACRCAGLDGGTHSPVAIGN